VWPAYQFFAGQTSDLPDYRSHLLIWCLQSCIWLASKVGVTSALAQVRCMYLGLALISLLGIYGTYLFVRARPSKLFAPLCLYLVAAFPLMPFLSTRAFGESVATSLVLLGFGWLEDARAQRGRSVWRWACGFAFLGLAVLFRFHVGILYLAYGMCLLWLREWRGLLGATLAGLWTLTAEYGIDWLSGKPPFGTLISYLAENEGGAEKYGSSPWYNTWAFVLALTLPPFSLLLARHLPALWRRHWPWLLPFLLYVLAHSLVPHKEERFLYPVVGLELWALAWLWAASQRDWWAKKVYSPAFFIFCVPLLLVACLVNTQEGEIEPAAYAESRFQRVIYLDHESLFGQSRIQFYFLRPPSVLEHVERESFNARKVDQALEGHPDFNAVVMLTSVPAVRDELRAMQGIQTLSSQCHEMRNAGSLIDRLLYSLNPKHNQRRRPTWYLVCERGS
jgi:hypothetical protein